MEVKQNKNDMTGEYLLNKTAKESHIESVVFWIRN